VHLTNVLTFFWKLRAIGPSCFTTLSLLCCIQLTISFGHDWWSIPRACPRFFIPGAKTEEVKVESGMGFLGRGQQPLPTSYGVWGSAGSPIAGFGAEHSKGFPLFSALRMTSPDTIILLIVDYHAAIGEAKTPLPSPWRTPPFDTSWIYVICKFCHNYIV